MNINRIEFDETEFISFESFLNDSMRKFYSFGANDSNTHSQTQRHICTLYNHLINTTKNSISEYDINHCSCLASRVCWIIFFFSSFFCFRKLFYEHLAPYLCVWGRDEHFKLFDKYNVLFDAVINHILEYFIYRCESKAFEHIENGNWKQKHKYFTHFHGLNEHRTLKRVFFTTSCSFSPRSFRWMGNLWLGNLHFSTTVFSKIKLNAISLTYFWIFTFCTQKKNPVALKPESNGNRQRIFT